MKYYEKRTWSLTSCTTTYSGVNWLEQERKARLATALHQVNLDVPAIRRIEHSFSSHGDEGFMVCVGYSAVGEWEGVSLMETPDMTEGQQGPAVDVPVATIVHDNERTSSNQTIEEGSVTQQSGTYHRRNLSGDSISTSHVLPSETSFPDFSSLGIPDHSATEGPDIVEEIGRTKATLILRRNESDVYRRNVTFRPVSPTVAEFVSSQGRTVTGLFVGSSDHNKLYWYLADSSFGAPVLLQHNLENEVFQVPSCVLGIGFLASNDADSEHTLALTCQDGTIRLISFRYDDRLTEDGNFRVTTSETFLVDGPLISVHLTRTDEGMKAAVGSLCGFAARLDHTGSTWQGPFIIAKGFSNSVGEEDCVLTVHIRKGFVYIGLLSGRLLIFEEERTGKGYVWKWECQLPHSIHGIAVIEERSETLPYVLVTTRWSIHLLSPLLGDSFPALSKKPSFLRSDDPRARKKYNSDLARDKILEMAKEHETKTREAEKDRES